MKDAQELAVGWKPLLHEVNFRIEVDFDGVPIRSKQEAESLAREVSVLRGIKGFVVWDVKYECPNCHTTDSSLAALRGCCEVNPI